MAELWLYPRSFAKPDKSLLDDVGGSEEPDSGGDVMGDEAGRLDSLAVELVDKLKRLALRRSA